MRKGSHHSDETRAKQLAREWAADDGRGARGEGA